MRALTPPIRIAMTETTTPVMAPTAPITVPMIHFVSLLTLESYYSRVAGRHITERRS